MRDGLTVGIGGDGAVALGSFLQNLLPEGIEKS
jgi:hypothetical protein